VNNISWAARVPHTPPSPYRTAAEPGGTSTAAQTEFVFGSMRESFPLGSVTSQTASSLVAMPPSLSAGPAGTVAITALVLMSTREIVLSPQFGTQMLSNPAAKPEQGRLPTAMV